MSNEFQNFLDTQKTELKKALSILENVYQNIANEPEKYCTKQDNLLVMPSYEETLDYLALLEDLESELYSIKDNLLVLIGDIDE